MSLILRLVALACTLPLALAACSPASPGEASPSPSADRIVTDPQSTAAASTSSAPATLGGEAHAEVVAREEVATDLEAPWDLEVMHDGSLLVSERDTGIIKRVRAGVATTLNGPGADSVQATIENSGEGGLLGIAVHRGESLTHLYAYVTRAGDNAVLRMDLHDDLLGLPAVVLEGIPSARNHDGGRIAFGPDGYLYIGTGDAARPELARATDSLAGKILRVVADGTDADGTAAPGNPWDNRVWSSGHRNVQGFGWVADGRMYASEFGQDSWDELNLIAPGLDYGWPDTEGMAGAPTGTRPGATTDGVTFPVEVWDPDQASPSGVAVTHEAVYVAALRGERLWRIPLTIDGLGTPEAILAGVGRVRDVAVAPDGSLYVLTNNTDGRGAPVDGDDRLIRLVIEQAGP